MKHSSKANHHRTTKRNLFSEVGEGMQALARERIRKSAGRKSTKRRFASVWDTIADTPAEVASMKARAELMNSIIDLVKKQGLTQAEAAKCLGVTQPRVSALMRGKISLFSLDTLVDMHALAGQRVEIKVKREAVHA